MDQNLNAPRLHSQVLGFNATRTLFILGNMASMAVISFADLGSQAQLALASMVVIVNIASLLSFDQDLKTFAALSADTGDEKSPYASLANTSPWGAFRVFCLIICIVAAVTQVMAIYA